MQAAKKLKKQKVSIKKLLKTEDKKFVGVLYNKRMMVHKMKRIQSKLHRIETYDVSKISFLFWW